MVRAEAPAALPASKKARALLGYLTATGRPHLRERLCELLWDGPHDPRASLRWALTKLRPVVSGGGQLVADREHVAFEATTADVDVAAVRALGDVTVETTEVLEAAAARFRGPFLEGLDLPGCVRFNAWCVAEREQLQTRHVAILRALIDRLSDRPEAALAHARTLLALEPLAESSQLAVMRLLAELGRAREAVAAYDGFRRLLETELGTRPSAEFERARMALGRVREVVAEAPAPPPAPAPAQPVPALPLVGRAAERAVIAGLLDRGRSGELLLIQGDPGVGKTRLLDHLRASAAGTTVLAGRAFEAERVRPYGVWIDALRGAALPLERAERRADLASLLPELGAAPPGQDRSRLFEAVAATVRELCAAAPVLIILDDLQWLDEASAALLHFLGRELAGAPVLFAATVRPAELDDNPLVLRVVRAFERERRLIPMPLHPLDEADNATLVRLVGPALDAARIFAEAGGNPLFTLEMARALGAGDANPADTLAGLLQDRLARFEGPARTALSFGAAIGRSFEVDVLGRVTGLGPAELLGTLEQLERHGVLRAAGASGYDFAHDLVRRAAYRQMSEPRRRLVHAQIARVLAALPDPDGGRAGDVAHHAGLGGERRLAAEACLTAGNRCLRLFAHQQAHELGQRGLHHASALPPKERLPLQVELLGLQVQALRGSRARVVEAELARALVEAQAARLAETEARAHRFLSLIRYESGDYAGAQAASLRHAEVGRTGPRIEAANELAASARCFALLERDLDRADALIEEASAAFGPDAQVVDVFWTRGLLRQLAGDTDQAVADLSHAVTLAARAEMNWEQSDCLMRLALLELERGRPAEALPWCERLAAVAGKMGDGYERPVATALRALAQQALGRPARELGRALDDLRAADAKAVLSAVLNLGAGLALGAGGTEASSLAREALAAAAAVSQRSQQAIARALLARLAAAAGDRAGARAHLEAVAADLAEPRAVSAHARAVVEQARAVVLAGTTAAVVE